MKRTIIAAALAAVTAATAYADTYHYACKSDGEDRYKLTVNTDRRVVKIVEVAPPHTVTTFRILRQATVDDCAKYGWVLIGGATFCTATQGVGDLNRQGHGPNLDCDNADTE